MYQAMSYCSPRCTRPAMAQAAETTKTAIPSPAASSAATSEISTQNHVLMTFGG